MSDLITVNRATFDSIKHVDDCGAEFWYARELQEIFGYTKWQGFENTIKRAKLSMSNSGINPENHVIRVNRMVEIGSGAERRVDEYKLTRLGCYLVAMNGDPHKSEIALAQSYFCVMTIFSEQAVNNSNEIDTNIKLFSEKNHQLAADIGRKAIDTIRENNLLKRENLELKQRLAKLDIPALPPTEGVRIKELLRCCGVTINSNDGNLFSRIALDIKRAVDASELPKTVIVTRGRYKYSATVENWIRVWLVRNRAEIA